MSNGNFWIAFTMTLIAGLATSLGSLTVLISKKISPRFLSGSLGFSAGVMLYVSFVEIIPESIEILSEVRGEKMGNILGTLGFFAGIAIIGVIDMLVPSFENPHEIHSASDIDKDEKKLMRMGLFSALAIAIHNFPEGFATFMAALHDPALGLSITVAIALHNIPEGIAISIPIFYATKSRKKAFLYSSMSGLAEPLGAIVGYFLLRQFLSDTLFGLIFSSVAGIMVYISLDELLPTAEKFGEHHIAIGGLIAGMAVMAGSLLLFL